MVSYITDRLACCLKDELYEIIFIISPDSTKETFRITEELRKKYPFVKRFIQSENPGLGRAVRQGLSAASGTHVLMMDSDLEMDPDAVPVMMEKMKNTGCDMVIGSRWVKGAGAKGYALWKYFLNRGFQIIFRLLFSTRIHDLTMGFKLMRKEVASTIQWNSTFNEIAVETTLRPIKKGYWVEEVPVLWSRRASGASKNIFRRNFRYVWKAVEILLQKSTIRPSSRAKKHYFDGRQKETRQDK